MFKEQAYYKLFEPTPESIEALRGWLRAERFNKDVRSPMRFIFYLLFTCQLANAEGSQVSLPAIEDILVVDAVLLGQKIPEESERIKRNWNKLELIEDVNNHGIYVAQVMPNGVIVLKDNSVLYWKMWGNNREYIEINNHIYYLGLE